MAEGLPRAEFLDFCRTFAPYVGVSEILIFSVKRGNLNMFQWVWEAFPEKENDTYWCECAAQYGQIPILQWLRAQHPPCPWSEETCVQATRGGQIAVLQWLRSQEPSCPWDAETCAAAAYHGHLHVLKWLRNQNPPCPWDETVCKRAARGGHLEVLKWLREQNPPCSWDETVCRAAAIFGHLEVLKWATKQGCPWDVPTVLDVAESHESWTVMKWILSTHREVRTRHVVFYDIVHDEQYEARRWLKQNRGFQWQCKAGVWMDAIAEVSDRLRRVLCADLIALIQRYT